MIKESDSFITRPPTLRKEATLVLLFFLFVAGGGVLSGLLYPEPFNRPGSAFTLLLFRGFVHNLGHAIWIGLDCRRRGRAVEGWRPMAFWFGPIVVPVYLIAEYRAAAAVHVPLYVALESTALAGEPATMKLLGTI